MPEHFIHPENREFSDLVVEEIRNAVSEDSECMVSPQGEDLGWALSTNVNILSLEEYRRGGWALNYWPGQRWLSRYEDNVDKEEIEQ